ncbi:MAG: hypothetical protein GY884_27960 [Proteobacteria bacterium]|nr:hypothetical protein [Pseudomonadota bacterium]
MTEPESGDPPIDLPDVEVEVLEGFTDSSDYLFNRYMVHTVEITLDSGAVQDLYDDPDTYVVGGLTFDGEPLDDVAVRLKGMYGSFRSLDEKAGFKIDLNDHVPGRRLYGVEKLTLNNAVVDCSYTKEHLGYHVYRAAGVPAPRTGFAWVTLNDEPYGLYVLVETPDDRLLADHFEDPSGTLYDGKYLWYDDGSYQLLDFFPHLAELYQQEEGPDLQHADMQELTDTLDAVAGTSGFYDDMGQVLSWERYHQQVAVAQYIGHVDGYSMNTNNYRVYFDPADEGRAMIIPWDLDYAFIEAQDWGRSWRRPIGTLTDSCWDDEDCKARQGEVVEALLTDVIDQRELEVLIDEVWDTIEDDARDDPRRECGTSSMGSYRAHLRNWVDDRPRDLDNFWDL